jgi:DNA-binding transcriptional LysR family regulator
MDLSIKPLRCLVAVAELQSFTRAAERLHMTQPSLSIQISQLERHIGFRLFERSTRQVELTTSGKILLEHAVRLIQESDRLLNAASEIRGDLTNRLRLGAAIYTFDIMERRRLIEGFMDAYPKIDLRVDAHRQSEILQDLAGHNLDVALIIGLGVEDEDFESGGRAELTFPIGLRRLTIRRERVGLRVAADSPLACYPVIPASALRGQTVVVPSVEHGTRLMQPILELLKNNGATTIEPPEATGTAIERYGYRLKLPALTFGWFDQPPECDTVRRDLETLDLHTEFAILSRQNSREGATARFLAFAERICGFAYAA